MYIWLWTTKCVYFLTCYTRIYCTVLLCETSLLAPGLKDARYAGWSRLYTRLI